MNLLRRNDPLVPFVVWYEGWTDPSMDHDGNTEPLTFHHVDPDVALAMFKREVISGFVIYRVAVNDGYIQSRRVYGMRETPDPTVDEYGWLDYRDKPDPGDYATYVRLSHELSSYLLPSPRTYTPVNDKTRSKRRRREPEHFRFWTSAANSPAGGETTTRENHVPRTAAIIDYDSLPTGSHHPMFQHDATVMPDGTVTNVKHELAWGPMIRDGADTWGWLDYRDIADDPRRAELARLRAKYEGVS